MYHWVSWVCEEMTQLVPDWRHSFLGLLGLSAFWVFPCATAQRHSLGQPQTDFLSFPDTYITFTALGEWKYLLEWRSRALPGCHVHYSASIVTTSANPLPAVFHILLVSASIQIKPKVSACPGPGGITFLPQHGCKVPRPYICPYISPRQHFPFIQSLCSRIHSGTVVYLPGKLIIFIWINISIQD